MRIRHKGLRALAEEDRASRVPDDLVPKLRRVLTLLDEAQLGCTRQALSRLLNGKAGISPTMALSLEHIGWSNASFWMRLQAAYELAQERRRQAA